MLEATGSPSKIEHRELPKDDPTRRCPDVTKAKRELGWESQTDIATGLKATVAYYRQKLGL